MRESIRASTSAFGLLAIAIFSIACRPSTSPASRNDVLARQISVTSGRVTLRASAYVELHLWLATSAKSEDPLGPDLDGATRAYRGSLADDDADALLDAKTRALSACIDDPCAVAAFRDTGIGRAYERALPIFFRRDWRTRATIAWAAIERAHAVLQETAEAVLARVASELLVTLPEHVVIDVVAEAPPPARLALFPKVLAARSGCLGTAKGESDRVRDARVLDCVLVRGLLDRNVESPLRTALAQKLGIGRGERAWNLLVVHVTGAILRSWEPKHASVDRRSASSVESTRLDWLARHWRGPDALEEWAAQWLRDDATTSRW